MTGMAGTFRLKFWGTRGSIPSPGSGTLKYGGNTSCLEVRCDNELIIIDAGTGIRGLGTAILRTRDRITYPFQISALARYVEMGYSLGVAPSM